MKKTNKIFAVILSLVLLIATAMPVYADDSKTDLKDANIAFENGITEYEATGKPVTPDYSVMVGDVLLTRDVDYTEKFENNTMSVLLLLLLPQLPIHRIIQVQKPLNSLLLKMKMTMTMLLQNQSLYRLRRLLNFLPFTVTITCLVSSLPREIEKPLVPSSLCLRMM